MSGGKKQSTNQSSTAYDNRQVNTDSNNMSWGSNNTTITDGGAIAGMAQVGAQAINAALALGQGALGNATTQAAHAYDYADGLFHASLDAVNDAGTRELSAYDRAAAIANDALAMSRDASKSATAQVQMAYADAKGTTDSQKQIILGVLAVAGVAVFASIKAKG